MGVKTYRDQELLERLKIADGFNGLPGGILDIWIRSDEDEYDRFDDKVYTFDCSQADRDPRFVMVCTGTSNAGSQGLKNFQTYNRDGCAVLKGDCIVYYSHAYGLHKGKPAYRQVKPFPYFRDNDRDNRAEEIGPEHNDIIGANCHRAGKNSTYIGGWSVACLVRNNEAQFLKWLRFMNRRPLTVAILKEW